MHQPIPVPDRKRYRCFKCGAFVQGFGALTSHTEACTDDRRRPCPHCGNPAHASVVCPPKVAP